MNTTSVIVDYAYTLIKIGFLKNLIMDDNALQKMDEISDIKEFIDFVRIFYPGLKFNTYTIEEIERSFFHTYIRLIGKIISNSPGNMRLFLKNYLMKYEIINIKHVILGTILGMNSQEKARMVNMLVEKYLNNTEFMRELLELSSLEQIQLFMKSTKYAKVIREGILYFKNTNEVFVLEAFLDQLYYTNLKNELKFLNQKERTIISLYVSYISEIYNLNMIYRGIKNNIDRKLLAQFLVDTHLFIDNDKLENLLIQSNTDKFVNSLVQILKKTKELNLDLSNFEIDKRHVIWSIESLYLEYFFKNLKVVIDDIDYNAIFKIIEVLIKKDKEIRLFILPKLVSIINEKYKFLK